MKATYKSYPSNLTPAQWRFIAPAAKPGGRPRQVDMQAVLNAILYVLSSGCAWRMLPGDFPAWQTVYTYFRNWRLDETWKRIHRYLHEWIRLSQSRHSSPSVAIIDSQSVKIGCLSNHAVGLDGGKHVTRSLTRRELLRNLIPPKIPDLGAFLSGFEHCA